jgi:hypothetical protein
MPQVRDLSQCQHATRETLEAELIAGRTPCGDGEEDGSGRGLCYAGDGSSASYQYRAVDGRYEVFAHEITSG